MSHPQVSLTGLIAGEKILRTHSVPTAEDFESYYGTEKAALNLPCWKGWCSLSFFFFVHSFSGQELLLHFVTPALFEPPSPTPLSELGRI